MERLFLYITGSMILLAFTMGCLHSSSQQRKREDLWGKTVVSAGLADADTLIANGDYALALQRNEETAARYPEILADQILYQKGLIHAHPRNPEPNFPKAIEAFRELKETFPDSGWVLAADAWMMTLEGIVKKDQSLSALKKDLQKREKTIGQLNTQASARLALTKQLNNRVLQLESQVADLERQVADLESQLEKLKKVDLGIEEKKRTSTER
jgi:peptidoglycan hydrolase CwlO-like protein